jgi:ABC-2 type transport system ATP-binding protein
MSVEVLVRDLVKSYGDVAAVRGVSFDVGAGEIFGLLGPNGAGKTTTLECILGLRHPEAGSITVAGIDALSQRNQVKEMIGAALQSTGLQEKITPREALKLFASFYRHAIDSSELISRFSLEQKADASVDTLSGGQRQRLALALAFVNDPKLVFLDEPTAGLDPQSRRELYDIISQMRTDGHTVVLTTHYIEEAHHLCDRIAIIDHGKVIAAGTPEQLINNAKAPAHVVVRTTKPMDLASVQSLPGVLSAEQIEGAWHLGTSNSTQTVTGLIKQLEAGSNELRDLQMRRPTLEDVFIDLTGNRLDAEEIGTS